MADLPAHPLDSRDLAAFVAAMETASMHAAADQLTLTQSAVTKRVQALEKRLGVSLLSRGRFGVRPTDAGRALYPEARQALDTLMRAESMFSGEARLQLEELFVAASHTIGEYLVPGWLDGFRRQGGRLRAHLEIVNSPGVLRALRAGDVQIGFVEGLDSVTDLDTLVLARDEIVAVVAEAHPWAREERVSVEQLTSEPYLTREEGSGTRAVAESALAGHGVALVPSLEAASTGGLKRAVLGGGFALLSRLTVEREAGTGELRPLTIAGVDTTRDLRAVRRRETKLPGAAQDFWGWLATVVC